GLGVPARRRLSAAGHDRGPRRRGAAALRVLDRALPGAHHGLGRAAPPRVRRALAAAANARAEPVSSRAGPPPRRLPARARRGGPRLEPLPGGRTRLVGRTRYELRVFPAAYWGLWSDALIHAIHARVLEHIERVTDRS